MSNEDTPLFAGSSPAMRTIFPEENGDFSKSRTDSAQITFGSEAELDDQHVRFPKVIRNKKTKAEVTIYGKSKGGKPNGKGGITEPYPFYRVCWRVDGQRRMQSFKTYSEAKAHADTILGQLSKGSRVTALTASQANDALAAFERLQRLYVSTGRRVSLFAAVSDYAEAVVRVPDRTIAEMVDGFLGSVASVKRKDIAEAVNEFVTAEETRTKAPEGQRSQLSSKYAYNRAIMLRRFASAFPNTSVCELTKDHIDRFMGSLAEVKSRSRNRKPAVSAKSRNHHRAAIRQFFSWCVRKDFLPVTHRLAEADRMRTELSNTSEVMCYTPAELKALLDAADGSMQAMIAMGGLAGLRTAELLRLNWSDVWCIENHIEITSGKSKTRQRRLVQVCPALAAWLEPFRNLQEGKVCDMHEITWQQHFGDLCEKARVEIKGKKVPVTRKQNGLRHSFCTYHFALHANENLTAAEAGNSPSMIHAHYRGLATKKEAEAWFAISPETAANVIPLAQTARQ